MFQVILKCQYGQIQVNWYNYFRNERDRKADAGVLARMRVKGSPTSEKLASLESSEIFNL